MGVHQSNDLEKTGSVDMKETDQQMETYNDPKAVDPAADYSGAVAKTSAEEIALVKKLDWRIMYDKNF